MVKLSAIEARVVGVLMEKETTTPDVYPMSLNATVTASNQKSSRDPVMELSEADVRSALFSLEELGLVRTLADARVSKFEHRMREGVGGQPLRRDEVAVLCLLLLRGPQTSAELRARAERLYSFDDNTAAQTTLERLAGREEPLVALLPRQPGSREARWAQLLTGEIEPASFQPAQPGARSAHDDSFGEGHSTSTLLEKLAALEATVRGLEERIGRLEGPASEHRAESGDSASQSEPEAT